MRSHLRTSIVILGWVLGHQLVEFRDHQSSTLLIIKMEHCQEWLLFGSLPKINITRIKFWPVSAHPNHYLKAMQTDESNKIVIIADTYPPAD